MHEITELIRALAWPLTTLAIFLILRVELQRFAKNMADRVRSATSVTVGPRGVELKGLLRAVPLRAEVQTRKVALIRAVRRLTDKDRLDQVADILSVPRSTDATSQIKDIILELNGRIESEADMEQISKAVKPIIGREY